MISERGEQLDATAAELHGGLVVAAEAGQRAGFQDSGGTHRWSTARASWRPAQSPAQVHEPLGEGAAPLHSGLTAEAKRSPSSRQVPSSAAWRQANSSAALIFG